MSDLLSHSNPFDFPNQTIAKQFLRFYLHPNTKAMLPLEQITEVLKIQFGRIVPIPQMPAWVMGVYNWRGDILWTIDLGDLLGLDSWDRHPIARSNLTTIVLSPYKPDKQIESDRVHLGLVVSRVEDLEICDPTAIQSALSATTSALLTNFLQGYWLKPEGDMILALDGKAIAAAMPRNSTD